MHVRVPRSVLCLIAFAAVAIAASACSDSPTAPANYAPFSQADLRVGTGTEAAVGRALTTSYSGWLYDETKPDQKGVRFDTSIGREPLAFTLATGEVIQGWVQGLPGMKVGGLRRLVIPPSLGYGAERNGPIPPNSTLVFEVELLSVQ